MPRPGPRPYECVRRAWHSERHHPIRGSLIKEMFRVVNEIHGPSTRRNKEWQQKLPVVVLKAEEIIYSKANSEAEYMDLATLLDRTNDAIDTIIRRDETTEIGEPLHPCIEAALTLGCTPRRATRSQRNVSTQSYLRQSTWELAESSPGFVGRLSMGYDRGVVPDKANSSKARCFPLCLGNGPCSYGLDSAAWTCSGYPLYSGSCTRFLRDACGFEVLPPQCGVVGNAIGTPRGLAARIVSQASEGSNRKRTEGSLQCDLSLRLGPNPDAENIRNDQRPATVDYTTSKTNAPVWYSNKRSFLVEDLNGEETASRKKIANATLYAYPAKDHRHSQFGPPVLPTSGRGNRQWRN